MKRKLFLRCNGGHYFQGTSCPFDAWTMAGAVEIVEAAMKLEKEGKEVAISMLVSAASPAPELLRRMLVIEFADDAAMYDAVAPDRYIYGGSELLWSETGDSLN